MFDPISYRGESAHTERLFIADKTLDSPYDFFLSECHFAHTARFFIGAIVCDNGRRGPIVGLLHSDFYRNGVRAHEPFFLS